MIENYRDWRDAAEFFDNTHEVGVMCGTSENPIQEWRRTLAVCQNSKENGILDESAWAFWLVFVRYGMLNMPEYC